MTYMVTYVVRQSKKLTGELEEEGSERQRPPRASP